MNKQHTFRSVREWERKTEALAHSPNAERRAESRNGYGGSVFGESPLTPEKGKTSSALQTYVAPDLFVIPRLLPTLQQSNSGENTSLVSWGDKTVEHKGVVGTRRDTSHVMVRASVSSSNNRSYSVSAPLNHFLENRRLISGRDIQVERRSQYLEWTEKFERDLEVVFNYNVATWSEVCVIAIVDATKDLPVGDPLRLAAFCYVLDRMLTLSTEGKKRYLHPSQKISQPQHTQPQLVGNSRSGSSCAVPLSPYALNIIRTELYCHIYCAHRHDVGDVLLTLRKNEQHPVVAGGGGVGGESSGSVLDLHEPGGQPPQPLRPCYVDLLTYVKKCEKIERQVTEMKTQNFFHGPAVGGGAPASHSANSNIIRRPTDLRSVSVMRAQLKSIQQFVLRACFFAWRGCAVKNRDFRGPASKQYQSTQELASLWVGLARRTTDRSLQLVYFKKWKRFVGDRHSAHAALQLKVFALERELLEKTKQLKQREAALNAARQEVEERDTMLEAKKSSDSSMVPRASGMNTAREESVREIGLFNDALAQTMKMKVEPANQRQWPPEKGTPVSSSLGDSTSEHPTKVVVKKAAFGTDTPFFGVENVSIPTFLEHWAKELIRRSTFEGQVILTSIDAGLVDGSVYIALLSALFPQAGVESAMKMDSIHRIDYAIQLMNSYGLDPGFISTAEVTNNSVSNFAVMWWLFHCWYLQVYERIELFDLNASDSTSLLYTIICYLNISRMYGEAFRILDGRIYAYCILSALKHIRSLSQDSAAQIADRFEFTTIREHYLAEVEERISVRTEMALLNTMLNNHYLLLKQVFDFYRGLSSSNHRAGIAAKDFLRFVEDTQLCNRQGLTLSSIQNLLPKVGGSSPESESRALLSKEKFVELLVRMAAIHVNFVGPVVLEAGYVTSILEGMINKEVSSRAMTSAKSDFKNRITDPRVQDIFSAPNTQKVLLKTYRKFGSLDGATAATSLNRSQFAQMLTDLHLIDKQMTRKDVYSIFSEVQDDEVGGLDEGGQSMSYVEFTEALCAVALFKIPHPLLAVHIRIRKFLNEMFVPQAKICLKLK